MATEALTDIANALSQVFPDALNRQWNRVAEAASRIRVVNGVGKNAAWDVQFSGTNVASNYAEGSDVQTTDYTQNPNIPATLSWGHYRQSFSMTDTEMEAAASSLAASIPTALVDLFGERVQNAIAKLASDINVDIFTGTGTYTLPGPVSVPNIVGLLGGALDATGTYATIVRGTYAEWAGNVLANGGVARPLTEDLLYQLEQNIFTASGEKPDLILCSPGVARKYAGLFVAEKRVVTSGEASPVYASGTMNMFWNGMPVIRDRNCSSGYLIMVNSNNLELKQLPNKQARDVMRAMEQLQSSNGMTQRPLPLVASITPLARTGDAVKMMCNIKLALCAKRPNSMGYIKDINET